MVTLKEIEKTNDVNSLRRISKQEGLSFGFPLYKVLVEHKYGIELDFDVYLESKGFNLQRPYVWTEHQQEELIWSMLYGRYIPPVTFVCCDVNDGSRMGKQIYKVIDGKQRLMTIRRYMMNEFPIYMDDGRKVYWDDLDDAAKYQISNRCKILYSIYHSYTDTPITDDEMIIIFNFYNFTGTPQEQNHKSKLLKALNK